LPISIIVVIAYKLIINKLYKFLDNSKIMNKIKEKQNSFFYYLSKKLNMKILGLDPGTNILGYAIIEIINKKIELEHSGIVDLRSENNDYKKLQKIFNTIKELINKYHPNECAIESPFYGKNAQSMLKLGRAQGVAIAAILQSSLSVVEYAPRKIKLSITGNGNASKEQVAKMVESILNTKINFKTFDQSDAIAIAICHFFNIDKNVNKQYFSWSDFARKKGLI